MTRRIYNLTEGPEETMETSGYYNAGPANQAMSYAATCGGSTVETMTGGLYIPGVPQGPVFALEGTTVTRVVQVEYESALVQHSVMASADPDTGVITLTIGCQSHPIARWQRIGPRIIKRQYGHLSAEQQDELRLALWAVIAAVEEALA